MAGSVTYVKSFLRAFTREKRYLTCFKFRFVSSPLLPALFLPAHFLARENAPLCGAFSLYFTISLVAISASLSLDPDLLRAAGVCLHVNLFASVCIGDLERGGRIIQPHRLNLGIGRKGVSDG